LSFQFSSTDLSTDTTCHTCIATIDGNVVSTGPRKVKLLKIRYGAS